MLPILSPRQIDSSLFLSGINDFYKPESLPSPYLRGILLLISSHVPLLIIKHEPTKSFSKYMLLPAAYSRCVKYRESFLIYFIDGLSETNELLIRLKFSFVICRFKISAKGF